jgi:hypothetical protein
MASASSLQAKAVSKRLQTMLSLPEVLLGAVLEMIGSDAIAFGSGLWKRPEAIQLLPDLMYILHL